MKMLNKKATGIFNIILGLLGENDYIKIDNTNGAFMPLSVERLYKVDGDRDVISLAHYFEQNGDLVQDPEMLFVVVNEEMIMPISIQHAFGRVNEGVVFENNKMTGVYVKAQKDMTVFAGMWLNNIKNQQGLNRKMLSNK